MTSLKIVLAAIRKRGFRVSAQHILDALLGALLSHSRMVLKKCASFPLCASRASRNWFPRKQRQAFPALPVLLCLFAALAGCRGVSLNPDPSADIAPPQLFMFSPLPAHGPAVGITAVRVDLGRRLYYDTHLSVNNSISCNDCHQLAKYGVDPGKAVSEGHNKMPGGRNSPTVYNAGLQFAQFWDGRAATLAAQASGPMMNPVEMGMPGPGAVLAYIHSNPAYLKAFRQAYPDVKDPVVMENVTDAIATFEEGLLTPSRWDEYLEGNTSALSDHEKEGLRVFLRSGCAACHAGTAMGGNSYAQLGAYRNWPDQKSDPGRYDVTRLPRDRMYFKVPVLRNVAETGPYFHNGQVKTLDEAVRLMGQYQTGEKLSSDEVSSIVSFLHALTGNIPEQYIQPPSAEPPSKAATIHHRQQLQANRQTQSTSTEGE